LIKKYLESGDKKAKGVKKNVIKREIFHSDYRDVIFDNKMMHQSDEKYPIRKTSDFQLSFK